MSRRYVIKSEVYSDDYRTFENLDEVRRYITHFYSPSKVKEIYVFSPNMKHHGNVIYNQNGLAFWYTPSAVWFIKDDGSLGKVVARYDKKSKKWHPFGL